MPSPVQTGPHTQGAPRAAAAVREPSAASPPLPGPWSRCLAMATFLSALPLVAFGGSVTTLGAGMAVEGWWNAEGHFLPLFPLEKWFRDVGTFVEHTHRMFGILVGLCAVALVIANALWPTPRGARLFAVATLVVISAQGYLGGQRVLLDSLDLAMLHGLLGQLAFAFIAVNVLWHREAWWQPVERSAVRAPKALAWASFGAVLAAMTAGVWYRHSLRPVALDDPTGRLILHAALAAVVVALVVMLGRRLASTGAAPLLAAKRRLHALLGLQVLLGLGSWLGYHPDVISRFELFATLLHVTVGALLLAQAAALVAWCARLDAKAG